MEVVKIFGLQSHTIQKIPFFTMSVAAGIPVTADSTIDSDIDLNEFLITHPASTFFAHVSGNNMKQVGIEDGDILIVDSSVEPSDFKVVIASLNNELSVKIYRELEGVIYLQTDHERFLPMSIDGLMEFRIIGVVTKVIHSL